MIVSKEIVIVFANSNVPLTNNKKEIILKIIDIPSIII